MESTAQIYEDLEHGRWSNSLLYQAKVDATIIIHDYENGVIYTVFDDESVAAFHLRGIVYDAQIPEHLSY